jgi:hypothetical protein
MTTSFPGSLDSFVNPTSTDTLDSSTVPHAAQHDNLNDAVLAVETALGANLSKVGVLAVANTFTTSPQQITGAASAKGLIIKMNATTPGNPFEVQNSAATVLAKIDSSGNLYAPTLQSTTASTATLTTNADTGGIRIDTGGTGNKGLVIKFVGSATANPFEVQNVSSTPVLYVDNNGKVNAAASLSVGTVSPSVTVATLTGASGQTSDLLTLKNISGTVLSRINSTGQWQAPQPAVQGLIVKAATTITNASVTSAVGSGSATVFTYSAASQLFTVGQLVTTTGFTPSGYNATNAAITAIGTVTAGTTYTFTTANTTTGTSSGTGTATVAQSANLQEWQTTAGVNFAIGANGVIANGNGTATQGAPTIASASTIAPVNPIVFVSGTTTINTITAPAPISTYGGSIKIIPTGAFATGTSGNIAIASTAVVSKMLEMTYDVATAKWYPSY